ncbi:5-oxoprolinase subunit B family protein [Devosia sediminis]|uniref:Allophanate hydrolase subunit 1 n=1 Tax=Devosia sediminis TaxID=2798801 RepID=A0A934ITV1_9HYPH|nr:allophanate hydrolase subunit 1 [Devosia sediminis]MBJ3784237.1 allophanate hydrolase subunit 1 [Devosia sediminis]
MSGFDSATPRRAEILPLGDCALLVRFGERLDDAANQAALVLADRLAGAGIMGIKEIVPSLVSVLVRYAPEMIGPNRLAGEIALLLGAKAAERQAPIHDIEVRFDGPDVAEVAAALGLGVDDFILRHNAAPLRVLTTGFAPGFVYCGLHEEALVLPRRTSVWPMVPAGSVLFAAGQTAIVATDIPTGWHVIGQTAFRNFRPDADPPTLLRAGDLIRFTSVP